MNFWVPASMEETFESGGYKLEDRGARWIEAYVRLKPGVTRAQAQRRNLGNHSPLGKQLLSHEPRTQHQAVAAVANPFSIMPALWLPTHSRSCSR